MDESRGRFDEASAMNFAALRTGFMRAPYRSHRAGRRALLLATLATLLDARALRAQTDGKTARVGLLGSAAKVTFTGGLKAFREAPVGRYEELPALAAELVALPVDVIFAMGSPAAHAARRASTTTPIVMETLGDAVKGARGSRPPADAAPRYTRLLLTETLRRQRHDLLGDGLGMELLALGGKPEGPASPPGRPDLAQRDRGSRGMVGP